MPKVFLSYSREDSEQALRLYKSMTAAGIELWFDEQNLGAGADWEVYIRHAIRECRYFLCLISSNSVEGRGCRNSEIRQALQMADRFPESAIYFIPARLHDVEPPFHEISKYNYVDLFRDWDAGVRKMIEAVSIGPLLPAIVPTQDQHAIILGGVIGPRAPTFQFMAKLSQLGISSQVLMWNHLLVDEQEPDIGTRLRRLLLDGPVNLKRAQAIAEQIATFRRKHPVMPLYLVATSGGAMVGMLTCEVTEVTFQRIFMLSPCVPADRSIDIIKQRSEQPVVVFYNAQPEPRDRLSDMAAEFTGKPQAALQGFTLSNTDHVEQIAYDPEVMGKHYYSPERGHLECFAPKFVDGRLVHYFDALPQSRAQASATPPAEPSNPRHVAVVRAGAENVNAWRKQNPHDVLSVSGQVFTHLDLKKADLTAARLNDCRFVHCSFEGSILCEAEFYGASFKDSSLRSADLSRAVIGDTEFTRVDLAETKFHQAVMGGAFLSECDLSTARGLETVSHFSASYLNGQPLETIHGT